MSVTLYPVSRLSGTPFIPGDKSVSHRALLFGALAEGRTEITNILESGDVHSTWKCLEGLGAHPIREGRKVFILGRGLHGLSEPHSFLDCGNSGTTLRLLMGILAGNPFQATLVGDSSLSRRPMKRIASPLIQMGAQIHLSQDQFAPVKIQGSSHLKGISYKLPIASAQLKSALLLAGLYADGETRLSGKIHSRDHTERLLPHFGVHLGLSNEVISLKSDQKLLAASVHVPSDLSSAAFWIGAALIVPRTILELKNISLNPSRIGILSVLHRMGAKIETEVTSLTPEPIGSLRIRSSSLQGTLIHAEEVPSLIDELPLIAVLSTFAEGTVRVEGAEELRTKETDRIEAVAKNLRAMGAKVQTFPDGFSISGPQRLAGAKLDSFDDHRIAMAFSIAALRAQGPTEILNPECVQISYPSFYTTLEKLTRA